MDRVLLQAPFDALGRIVRVTLPGSVGGVTVTDLPAPFDGSRSPLVSKSQYVFVRLPANEVSLPIEPPVKPPEAIIAPVEYEVAILLELVPTRPPQALQFATVTGPKA